MREDARATPVHLQRRSRGRSRCRRGGRSRCRRGGRSRCRRRGRFRCRRRGRHLLLSRLGDVPLQGAAILGDEFSLRVRIAVGDVDAPLLARRQRCSAVSAAVSTTERALQPAERRRERHGPWISCNPGSSAFISVHQRSSALISAHQRSSPASGPPVSNRAPARRRRSRGGAARQSRGRAFGKGRS